MPLKLARKLIGNLQTGGAPKGHNVRAQAVSTGSMYGAAFVLAFIILLVKAWLVQVSYNYVMPHLLVSLGEQDKLQRFKDIQYVDALALVILASSLVS